MIWVAFAAGIFIGIFLIFFVSGLVLYLESNRERKLRFYCPRCHSKLLKTDTQGLRCSNGCYGSEFDLWLDLQQRMKRE